MKTTWLGPNILKDLFPPRKLSVQKYDFGHLLVIGGSKLYSGSPVLNALAAIKTGVDVVTVAAPERAANIIASFSPDLISYPLEGDYLEVKHLKELLKLSQGKTAFVIGGGITRSSQTFQLILSYLRESLIPVGCVDADAIHAIAQDKNILKKRSLILTPHLFEFYVLSGEMLKEKTLDEKIQKVFDFAQTFNTTIVLKGEIDIIADKNQVALNKFGSPYMTKGGTGDTLAGIVGSLLAQKISPFQAACGASYINGRAGQLAAAKYKQSLMAQDLINYIPQVLK